MVKHTHVTIMMDNLQSFSPEQPFMERKAVSTSEKGRKYVLALKPPHGCAVYQIDNYIVTTGERCDKLVLVEYDAINNQWAEIFVELKGVDVRHAIEQLRSSINHPIFRHPTVHKRYARLVAQSIPRNSGNSIVERARDEFRKEYAVELKCWSSSNKVDSIG